MSSPNWDQAEEIVAPEGAFIGWAATPGQVIAGRILDYNPIGGTDYAQQPCPQIALTLLEPAASFNKLGERTDYPAGELVNVGCGQANLKASVRAGDPKPGDLIRIAFNEVVPLSGGKTVKKFNVRVIRGNGAPPATNTATQAATTAANTAPATQAANTAQQPAAGTTTAPAAGSAPSNEGAGTAPPDFDQATWNGFDQQTRESILRMRGGA